MAYRLGVDLGTTYTAAAVERNGRVEVCSLGSTSPVVPSVVLLRADGEVLVGEAAVRRGADEPGRVAREFKRRLGDPTPLVLGGTPYGAEALMAHLLRRTVQLVVEREGERPERITLTHPANYGPYKLDMMREVARQAGLDLDVVDFLTEPQAAAISYSARNRVEVGSVVGVYDFGGGTFDAALVQRTDAGFTLLGRPEGMERFGGIDIDAAILALVDQSLDGAIRQLDPDDPAVQAAVSRLRDDCRAAKEALSSDTDTAIAVAVPGLQTSVRLTRRELEEMVRPRLRETIEAFDRAVRSAGLTMDRVSRILLVGGSSRMPAVADLLQRETGRPVAVDAHPKFAIATGAAGYRSFSDAMRSTAGVAPSTALPPTVAPAPVPPTAPTGLPPAAVTPPAPPVAGPSGAPPTPPPLAPTVAMPTTAGAPTTGQVAAVAPTGNMPFQPSAVPPPSRPDRTKLMIALGAVGVLVVAIAAFALFRGGGDGVADEPDDTEEVDDTDPPRPEPDETDPVVETTVTPVTEAAPTLPPPSTAPVTEPPPPAPVPLTAEQLQSALATAAELGNGWAPGVVSTDPDVAICGQTVTEPLAEAGALFNRTVDGQPQELTTDASTFADTATAQSTFQSFRNILRSCASFDTVDPSTGTPLTVFIQVFDETPIGGCQAALSARLDVFTGGVAVSSRLFALQVCANSAASAALTIPAIDAAFSADQIGQVDLALRTTVNKLIALPTVP